MPRGNRPKQTRKGSSVSSQQMEGAVGAADSSSGGGAGAGIPGGGTDMRTSGRFSKGDVEADRRKLFPEAKTRGRASSEREKT